jgi:hypothetical protein
MKLLVVYVHNSCLPKAFRKSISIKNIFGISKDLIATFQDYLGAIQYLRGNQLKGMHYDM